MPALALNWLDTDACARMLVDVDLRLYWRNAAARAQLSAREEVQERGGYLTLVDPAGQQALVRAVASYRGTAASVCIPKVNGEGHLLIRLSLVTVQEHLRIFGAMLTRTGRDHHQNYADLKAIFDLTHAQNRVLLLMLNGGAAEEVAQKLGISIETVRSHIRQIYAKVNVSTREALFSRMRDYRI